MRMLRLATTFATLLMLAAASSALAQTDLIISEYIEGTSNNKAIELYNPTGSAIDLGAGAYKIHIYFNGAIALGNNIPLNAVSIPSGGRYVVAHSSAVAAITGAANQTSGSLNFNGDDVVLLVKGGADTRVDIFGQIGVDPGAEWGAGLTSTADNTLRRKATVCDGDLNGDDVFDPSIQWDGFATDTFDGLGLHSIGCGPTPAGSTTWGQLKVLYR